MSEWVQTVRRLRRHAGFSLAIVVTLALAIAATVTVVSLVRGILLHQLPYPEAHRVLEIDHAAPGFDLDRIGISPTLYRHYAQLPALFEHIGLYGEMELTLTGGDLPLRIAAARATPSLFRVLGVDPVHGRTFTDVEGTPGAAPVVLLSHGLWQSDYGGDESVVGRQMRIDGVARQVVGIMPADFEFPSPQTRLWVPLVVEPIPGRLGYFTERCVARLADGVPLETADARLRLVTSDLIGTFPGESAAKTFQDAGTRPNLSTRLEYIVGSVRTVLWILVAAVSLILVIAAANVANLFLVRLETRGHELAIRSALGGGRRSLLRTISQECLLLAAAAGVGALVLTSWILGLIARLGPQTLPRLQEVQLDTGAVLTTLVGAALVTWCAGVLPALNSTRGDLAPALHEGGRTSASRERNRLRGSLVVAQVALSLVLLIACSLVLRSLIAVQAVDPGFRADGAVTFQLSLPETDYPDAESRTRFVEQARQRLSTLPGVSAVGAAGYLPLTNGLDGSGYAFEDATVTEGDAPLIFLDTKTSPGYFEAMGIPLVEGTLPGEDNYRLRKAEIVVSQSIARRFWPDGSALGKRTKVGDRTRSSWYTVVAVVGDVRLSGLELPADDMVYLPLLGGAEGLQDLGPAVSFVLRSKLPASSLAAPIRSEIATLDPSLPITLIRPLGDLLRDARASKAFIFTVLLLAASMALILAAVGLYGVLAYLVSRRTRELGLRMALGADGGRIRTLVLRQGLRLATLGAGLGLILALALSIVLESQLSASLLYEVEARDPLTFLVVPAGLLLVAFLATYVPAWRASRVDPLEALRQD